MTTIADYRERLDTEPLTPNQLGRIHAEFAGLGFHVTGDRAERLRLTAALAGCGPIATTKDLTMGEAGRVIRAASACNTAAELRELAEPRPEPVRVTLADAMTAVVLALDMLRNLPGLAERTAARNDAA